MASKKKQSFTKTKTRSNKIQQIIDVQNYPPPPPSPTEPCATWYSHLDTEVNLLITNIKHDTLEELLEKVASGGYVLLMPSQTRPLYTVHRKVHICF